MRKKIIPALVLLTFLITFSCSNEDMGQKDINKDYFKSVGIKSVQKLSQNDDLFKKFIASELAINTTTNAKLSSNDINYVELVTFVNATDKKLLNIRLNSQNSAARTSEDEEIVTEIAAIYSESSENFEFAWIQEYIINEELQTESVNHYWPNGSKFLTLTINTEDKKILSIESFENNSNGRTAAMTWSQCMKMAYESCSSDWECAILCGLIFTRCIAATSLACAYVAL